MPATSPAANNPRMTLHADRSPGIRDPVRTPAKRSLPTIGKKLDCDQIRAGKRQDAGQRALLLGEVTVLSGVHSGIERGHAASTAVVGSPILPASSRRAYYSARQTNSDLFKKLGRQGWGALGGFPQRSLPSKTTSGSSRRIEDAPRCLAGLSERALAPEPPLRLPSVDESPTGAVEPDVSLDATHTRHHVCRFHLIRIGRAIVG